MPAPLSLTVKSHDEPLSATSICTRGWSARPCLSALSIRFWNTCCRGTGSAIRRGMCGPTTTVAWSPGDSSSMMLRSSLPRSTRSGRVRF